MLRSLLTNLGEDGMVIAKNENLKQPEPNDKGKGKEELTVARLLVSKMKLEAKNAVARRSNRNRQTSRTPWRSS